MRFKIKHQARRPIMECDELTGHHFVETVHAGDAISYLKDITHGLHFELGLIFLDLFLNGLRDFFGFKH